MANEGYDKMLRLLLIGEYGIGKTSLLYRYIEEPIFVGCIGIDFRHKTVEIEGKKIKLQIWDTAGQERFRTIMSPVYYRKADGIFLVYDITSVQSFENLIKKWLPQVQQNAPENVVKILIGSKSDLEEERLVEKEKGEKLAMELGIPFFEMSAKSGENVQNAFGDMVAAILKQNPIGTAPASEFTVKPPDDINKATCYC